MLGNVWVLLLVFWFVDNGWCYWVVCSWYWWLVVGSVWLCVFWRLGWWCCWLFVMVFCCVVMLLFSVYVVCGGWWCSGLGDVLFVVFGCFWLGFRRYLVWFCWVGCVGWRFWWSCVLGCGGWIVGWIVCLMGLVIVFGWVLGGVFLGIVYYWGICRRWVVVGFCDGGWVVFGWCCCCSCGLVCVVVCWFLGGWVVFVVGWFVLVGCSDGCVVWLNYWSWVGCRLVCGSVVLVVFRGSVSFRWCWENCGLVVMVDFVWFFSSGLGSFWNLGCGFVFVRFLVECWVVLWLLVVVWVLLVEFV